MAPFDSSFATISSPQEEEGEEEGEVTHERHEGMPM